MVGHEEERTLATVLLGGGGTGGPSGLREEEFQLETAGRQPAGISSGSLEEWSLRWSWSCVAGAGD